MPALTSVCLAVHDIFFASRQILTLNSLILVGKVNNDQRDNTAVHDIWKRSHALLSIGTDWKDNATDRERSVKRHRMVRLSDRFTEIVGEDGGTYANEANPYVFCQLRVLPMSQDLS